MNEMQPNNPEMGMKDFVAVLRRRFWVILPLLLLSVAGAYAVTMGTPWTAGIPKAYRAESQLMLVQRAPSSSGDPADAASAQVASPIETEVALIQNREMARRSAAYMKNAAYITGQVQDTAALTQDQVQGAIKVTNPTDSNLLVVTADASTPTQARDLANAVAYSFVDYKKFLAARDVTLAQEDLAKKVLRAQNTMNAAILEETRFKQANHMSSLDAAEKEANDQFYNSSGQVIALNQKLAGASASTAALDNQLRLADEAVRSQPAVSDEAGTQALQADLNRLKLQRDDEAAQYTPDFPGAPGIPSLASLNAQIRAKQAQFDDAKRASTSDNAPTLSARSALAASDKAAHADEISTQQQLASAIQARAASQQMVQGIPDLQKQYARLGLATQLDTQLYTRYKGSLDAAKLQRDLISGNVTIAQVADLPALPFKPNLKTNLMLGFALGALLSLGLVMLLEQTDQRVRTLDEVRALVSGPIIGMLPRTSRGQMNALAQGRLLPQFEEAFSLVRVNLSYVTHHSMMREQVQHQTILVTSAVPGEGKSVTAAELARSMAQSGKSVILVDANLRRPSQNLLFQTGETGGLTDVLSGQLPLDEAIATSNVENLSILNSGVSSQNPTVLLSQPRLASVMEALRFKADVVIIDAPDCTSVADTLLLTAHADCLLQVVRAGAVDMETLHNASQALHATGKKVTVLANGLTRPQQRAFRSRFAYAALSSQSAAPPALPQTFEKTMVMNRSHDLVFSKSVHPSLENPEGTPEPNEAS